MRLTCDTKPSFSLFKFFLFSFRVLSYCKMEEIPQTKEEANPLDNLENWLRSECGLSVHIFRGICQPTDLPYLHVWNTRPPKDLTYLPSFHLIFTLKAESVFDLNLVTFNGKVIDTCEVDLVKKTNFVSAYLI